MKHLVINSNRGRIDYARALDLTTRLEGDVWFADYAAINGVYLESEHRFKIDNFVVSNPFPKYCSRILDQTKINNITGSLKHSPTTPITSEEMNFNRTVFEKSLISHYAKWFGSAEIKLTNIPKNVIQRERIAFIKSYENTLDLIRRFQLDCIYTQNGRFIVEAAIKLACMELDISCKFFENTTVPENRYEVFDSNPHSIMENRVKSKRLWEKVFADKPQEAISVAESHLKKRISGDWPWRQEHSSQMQNYERDYIAYFPTSDYEFAAVNLEISHAMSQRELFNVLVKEAKNRNMDLVVRVHPNPRDPELERKESAYWNELCEQSEVTCIVSSNPTPSLSLAKESYCSVVHMSSIGAEIFYLGYPLIIAAENYYSHLIPEFEFSSPVRIGVGLDNPPISSDPSRIYPWSYAQEKLGFSISLFEIKSRSRVFFCGMEIDKEKHLLRLLRGVMSKAMQKVFFKSQP